MIRDGIEENYDFLFRGGPAPLNVKIALSIGAAAVIAIISMAVYAYVFFRAAR